MEPIISPWLVYLAGTVEGIREFSVIIAIILGVLTGMLLFDCDINKTYRRWAKVTGTACIICILVAILVPTEKTVWMMIGASYMTPDNITTVQGDLVHFAEQIAKAIK